MDEEEIRRQLNGFKQKFDDKQFSESHMIEILYWFCRDKDQELNKDDIRRRIGEKVGFSPSTIYSREREIRKELSIKDLLEVPDEVCQVLQEQLAHLPLISKTFIYLKEGETEKTETLEVPDFSKLIWPPKAPPIHPDIPIHPLEEEPDKVPEVPQRDKVDEEIEKLFNPPPDETHEIRPEEPELTPQTLMERITLFFNETRDNLLARWEELDDRTSVIILVVFVGVVLFSLIFLFRNRDNPITNSPAIINTPILPTDVPVDTQATEIARQVAIETAVVETIIAAYSPTPSEAEMQATVEHAAAMTANAIAAAITTETPTFTNTPTVTPTPSITPTPTETLTPTVTFTPSPALFDDFEDGDSLLWSAGGDSQWTVEPTENGYELMCLRQGSIYYPDEGWTDYTFSADVRFETNTGQVGLLARQQKRYERYIAYLTTDSAKISREQFQNIGSGWRDLQTIDYQTKPGVTYHIEFKLRGIQLQMYVNGVKIVDLIDNSYSYGQIALVCGANTIAYFDNVKVELD